MRHFYIFLMLFPSILFAQNSVCVKGKGYKGYVFSEDYSIFTLIKDQEKRYTPTAEDIKYAESILNSNIDYLKEHQLNPLKGYPVIYKSLRKYIRQYVGYLNQSGDVVIWIVFLKDYQNQLDLSQEVVFMNDGGSYYWSIFVNLTQKTLYGMEVNGVS